MHANLAFLATFVIAVTPLLSIAARAANPVLPSSEIDWRVIRDAHQCSADEFWAEAGYVGHGKWRDAHCAKISGRQ